MPIKIGFVLLSSAREPQPSTRISVLNMLPFLKAADFDPHIVFESTHNSETPDVSGLFSKLLEDGFQIVYFQKVHGRSVVELAQQLSEVGIKTVYGVCDLIDIEMAKATDVTIVVTEYLKSLYPQELWSKIHVVHDGIEHPELYKTHWRSDRGSRKHPLRAILVTSSKLNRLPIVCTPPPWLEVIIVGHYPPAESTFKRLRSIRWNIVAMKDFRERVAYLSFLANQHIRCLKWDKIRVYEEMIKADIGIIPLETDLESFFGKASFAWKRKSENRLSMKMCVGLPVIATPIPSYEQVIDHSRNGFLAGNKQDWLDCLDALRDPGLRQAMGTRARESVMERFSMEEQSRLLIKILGSLVSSFI
jgi:glycosyltransferase involved in cell wall biosynthesis